FAALKCGPGHRQKRKRAAVPGTAALGDATSIPSRAENPAGRIVENVRSGEEARFCSGAVSFRVSFLLQAYCPSPPAALSLPCSLFPPNSEFSLFGSACHS